MKLKLLASLITTASLAWAGSASAIVVGGIDFGALGTTGHLETTTLAETLITGDDQELRGYGVVNTVNGNNAYSVAPGQQLFFYFYDYMSQDFSATGAEFTGGKVDIYLGATRNLLNFSSESNIDYIEGLSLWATAAGHGNLSPTAAPNATLESFGSLSGANINFFGGGLLDITGGLADVVAYLDSNNEADIAGGFADIAISTSGRTGRNRNDPLAPCQQQVAGAFCIQGSADLSGSTQVPEPGSLALLGLGLSFFGLRRYRKSA